MNRIASHLRNKLVAGAISVIPIAIVVVAAIYIEQYSKTLAEPFGLKFPGIGVLIAIVGVYILGVIVTSVFGQIVLGWLNYILLKVPGLNMVYRVWKEVLVSPPDKNGIFHQAVLVPTWHNQVQLGFTNNDPLPDDPNSICVLLPNIPNPFSGRMIIVKRDSCVFLKISVEEAMKFQLSTANYLPPGIKV
jgi:uncharacterized membrane protein